MAVSWREASPLSNHLFSHPLYSHTPIVYPLLSLTLSSLSPSPLSHLLLSLTLSSLSPSPLSHLLLSLTLSSISSSPLSLLSLAISSLLSDAPTDAPTDSRIRGGGEVNGVLCSGSVEMFENDLKAAVIAENEELPSQLAGLAVCSN